MSFSVRASCAAAFAALGLALAAGPAPAQIAPDTPSPGRMASTMRDLVGLYFQWRGPNFGELQSIHERLFIETADGREPGLLWMDRRGRTRREVVVSGVHIIQVAAPTGEWRVGADGKVENDPGAYERARRFAALQFGDALTGRAGATAVLAGTRDFADKAWLDVQVTFGDADAYDVLLDGATGGLCCYLITEKGVARTMMFGDWRLVDGVRMPFGEQVLGSQSAVAITTIDLNRDLDGSLFIPPPSPGGGAG